MDSCQPGQGAGELSAGMVLANPMPVKLCDACTGEATHEFGHLGDRNYFIPN